MTNNFLKFIVLDEDNDPVLNEQGLPKLLPRPDTKTTADIERLIALNKPVEVINKFAELVCLSKQWDWAQSYFDYLVECYEVNEYNASLPEPVTGEDGELIEAEPKILPVEPEDLKEFSVDEVLAPYARTLFKLNRQKAVDNLEIDFEGLVFDGDEISQGRMARAAIAMSDGESIQWVLADNSVESVNKSQLMSVLRLAGDAQASLWS